MKQGRLPISGKTHLYGLFADPIEHLQTPIALNKLLERRAVDAVFVPVRVAPEHLAGIHDGSRGGSRDGAGDDANAACCTRARPCSSERPGNADSSDRCHRRLPWHNRLML